MLFKRMAPHGFRAARDFACVKGKMVLGKILCRTGLAMKAGRRLMPLAVMLLVGTVAQGGELQPFSALKIDRPISVRQMRKLMMNSALGEIQVAIFRSSIEWLNRDAGTRAGRRSMCEAMARFKELEPMLREKLSTAHLPLELMAVPFVESGYRDAANGPASGIWQMIPETARSFGLAVNFWVDERHDAKRLTDAAIQYYAELYRYFGSWHLALLAYNTGGARLIEVIRKAGYADAVHLLEEGRLSPARADYFGRLMSTMLILKHPELLSCRDTSRLEPKEKSSK
jgi:hypothetical protein